MAGGLDAWRGPAAGDPAAGDPGPAAAPAGDPAAAPAGYFKYFK